MCPCSFVGAPRIGLLVHLGLVKRYCKHMAVTRSAVARSTCAWIITSRIVTPAMMTGVWRCCHALTARMFVYVCVFVCLLLGCRPLYLFDCRFADKYPDLADAYSVPAVFADDLFSLLGSSRPDYRWIIGTLPCVLRLRVVLASAVTALFAVSRCCQVWLDVSY